MKILGEIMKKICLIIILFNLLVFTALADNNTIFNENKKLFCESNNIKEKEKAFNNILDLAYNGLPNAEYFVASIYYGNPYNTLPKIDIDNAFKFFEKASKNNHDLAIAYYAYMIYRGFGVEKNIKKAISILKENLENNPYNNILLGFIYIAENHKNINDFKEIINNYSSENDSNGLYSFLLGAIYYENTPMQNYENALKYFKISSSNNPSATYYLAKMYLNGNWVKQDIQKAIELFNSIAKINQAAVYELYKIYSNGKYIKKDIIKAKKTISKYVKDDKTGLLLNIIAVDLLTGNGAFDLNIKAGINTLKKAMQEYNNSISLYNGGIIFKYGIGMPKNKEYAYRLFIESAKTGFLYSSYEAIITIIDLVKEKNDLKQFYIDIETLIKSNFTNGYIIKAYIDAVLSNNKENYNKHIAFLESEANKNNVDANYLLGLLYYKNDNYKKDIKKSILYFEKASSLNHFEATEKLIDIYNDKQDIDKVKYYKEKLLTSNEYKNHLIDIIIADLKSVPLLNADDVCAIILQK